MNDEETITMSKEEYLGLLKASRFLTALENAGVDNWSGYSFAQESYEDYFGEGE